MKIILATERFKNTDLQTQQNQESPKIVEEKIKPSIQNKNQYNHQYVIEHASKYDTDNYSKTGTLKTLSHGGLPSQLTVDKKTAAITTIQVNRATFDKIANDSTYGETKWQELGVDDEKRWIVINGQRFEVEHSPEEKALRKQAQSNTLVDILDELDKRNQSKAKHDVDNIQNDNIEALKENRPVMELLKSVFGVSSDADVVEFLK